MSSSVEDVFRGLVMGRQYLDTAERNAGEVSERLGGVRVDGIAATVGALAAQIAALRRSESGSSMAVVRSHNAKVEDRSREALKSITAALGNDPDHPDAINAVVQTERTHTLAHRMGRLLSETDSTLGQVEGLLTQAQNLLEEVYPITAQACVEDASEMHAASHAAYDSVVEYIEVLTRR